MRSYRLGARRKAILISAAWVDLSPPASKITTSRPRFVKYTLLTGTVINAQFRNPFSNSPDITRIAGCETLNTNLDARTSLQITKVVDPQDIGFSFANFQHDEL